MGLEIPTHPCCPHTFRSSSSHLAWALAPPGMCGFHPSLKECFSAGAARQLVQRMSDCGVLSPTWYILNRIPTLKAQGSLKWGREEKKDCRSQRTRIPAAHVFQTWQRCCTCEMSTTWWPKTRPSQWQHRSNANVDRGNFPRSHP